MQSIGWPLTVPSCANVTLLALFPFADLRKWVPAYAAELDSKCGSGDDKIMLMAHWQLAFDKFALGAAMIQSAGMHFPIVSSLRLVLLFLLCRKASSFVHVSQSPLRDLHESWFAC